MDSPSPKSSSLLRQVSSDSSRLLVNDSSKLLRRPSVNPYDLQGGRMAKQPLSPKRGSSVNNLQEGSLLSTLLSLPEAMKSAAASERVSSTSRLLVPGDVGSPGGPTSPQHSASPRQSVSGRESGRRPTVMGQNHASVLQFLVAHKQQEQDVSSEEEEESDDSSESSLSSDSSDSDFPDEEEDKFTSTLKRRSALPKRSSNPTSISYASVDISRKRGSAESSRKRGSTGSKRHGSVEIFRKRGSAENSRKRGSVGPHCAGESNTSTIEREFAVAERAKTAAMGAGSSGDGTESNSAQHAVSRAKAIQQLILEAGDEQVRCFEKCLRRRQAHQHSLGDKSSDAPVRIEQEAKKSAHKCRHRRGAGIVARLEIGIARTGNKMIKGCNRPAEQGFQVQVGHRPGLLATCTQELAARDTDSQPSPSPSRSLPSSRSVRHRGTAMPTSLTSPVPLGYLQDGQSNPRCITPTTAGIVAGIAEVQHMIGKEPPEVTQRRSLIKHLFSSPSIPFAQHLPLSAKRIARLPEIPRLRNKFRDQRLILSDNWHQEASTVKRYHNEVAAGLGLDEDDLEQMGSLYTVSVADLEQAAVTKMENERIGAAIRVQRKWRSMRLYRSSTQVLRNQIKASRKLQRWWHAKVTFWLPVQRKVRSRPIRFRAAVRLQAAMRGFVVRRKLHSTRLLHGIVWQLDRLQDELGGNELRQIMTIKAQAVIRRFLAQKAVHRKRREQREATECCEAEERAEAEAHSKRKRRHSLASLRMPQDRRRSVAAALFTGAFPQAQPDFSRATDPTSRHPIFQGEDDGSDSDFGTDESEEDHFVGLGMSRLSAALSDAPLSQRLKQQHLDAGVARMGGLRPKTMYNKLAPKPPKMMGGKTEGFRGRRRKFGSFALPIVPCEEMEQEDAAQCTVVLTIDAPSLTCTSEPATGWRPKRPVGPCKSAPRPQKGRLPRMRA